MTKQPMTKQRILGVLGGTAISLFAIALAQAGEMPSHKHAVKAWRHSYARMPVERDAPSPAAVTSPNLFETGRPPAQPGPAH